MQESKKHLQLPAARNELCKLFSGVLKYRPDQGLIAELTKEPYRSKTALRVLRNRYRPGGVKYQKPLIPPQNQNKKTETDLRRAFYEFEQYAKEGDIQAKYELALCFLEGKGAPISLDKAKPLLEELVWHKKCPHPLKVEKLLKTYFPLSPLPQKDPADQYGPSKLGPLIVEFANKVKRSVEHHKLK
jgi:hypothetical protein